MDGRRWKREGGELLHCNIGRKVPRGDLKAVPCCARIARGASARPALP